MSQITLEDLFDVPGMSRAERAAQLVRYQDSLKSAHADTANGRVHMRMTEDGSKTLVKGLSSDRQAVVLDNLEKSLSPDALAGVAEDISYLKSLAQADITKDWTPTNPVSTGLVPYDLEGPSKFLVPKYTPLRNTIPRVKGQGNARQYKRITSITNSAQPGGAARIMPFFNSMTATATFGSPNNLTLNRPPKISYTGDDQTRKYVELGFSDMVAWKAQWQGLGFEDLRSLSHTAVLWSHMMGEEAAMLMGRGATSGGYLGSVSAPTISAANAGTGGTIAADTYHCYVVALTGMGQSLASAVASTTTAGATSTITVTVTSAPAGAIYYALYVGDGAAGFANARFQRYFTGDAITITTWSGTGALGVDADTTFSDGAWDGFYAVQSDPNQSGYFLRHNGTFSTTTPGTEFDTALTRMHVNNGADPEQIWMTGGLRAAYSQLMRVGGASGAASGYRTTTVTGDGSAIMGTAVTGHVNPATQTVVDVLVHRFALPGTALIRSLSLPLQDSNVPAPVAMVNVQDYMGLDWPIIQMSFDVSTYQMGTMIHYAPAWSGLIVGIEDDNSSLV